MFLMCKAKQTTLDIAPAAAMKVPRPSAYHRQAAVV